jgi:endonuclease/exonuclease/phosphatase (EEP) superfamily protein YafD
MPTLKSKGQPNGYPDNAARLKDIKLIAVKASSTLAIFGGDFNTAEHRKTLINNGWTPALAAGKDTYDDPGIQAIDGLFTKGLAITDAKVIDPGKASDHKWITAQIRIG